ncbi:MAG: hypothetical protein ABJH20_00630, partial [Rhizobiaceae bacterium]
MMFLNAAVIQACPFADCASAANDWNDGSRRSIPIGRTTAALGRQRMNAVYGLELRKVCFLRKAA